LTKNIFNEEKLVPLEKAELFFCISDKLLFYLQIKKQEKMFKRKVKILIPIIMLLLAGFVFSGCKSGYKTVPCPRFHHI
jgi:hypothetical protein